METTQYCGLLYSLSLVARSDGKPDSTLPDRALNGRYAGYFSDPDTHLREIVFNPSHVPIEGVERRCSVDVVAIQRGWTAVRCLLPLACGPVRLFLRRRPSRSFGE
jgi:hypothetical protein